ncbi:MAG: hypothetical protein Kow0069_02850 [Promethearchaeota archaeon]
MDVDEIKGSPDIITGTGLGLVVGLVLGIAASGGTVHVWPLVFFGCVVVLILAFWYLRLVEGRGRVATVEPAEAAQKREEA